MRGRIVMRIALALLLFATAAHGQLGGGGGTGNYPGSVAVQQDGVPLGDFPVFELPSASWQPPISSGGVVTLVPLGGSGSGGPSALGLGVCSPVDGSTTLYLGPAGCADPAETAVAVRFKTAATFSKLSCWVSGSVGARTVTVRSRSGACGSVGDSALICTITTGNVLCDSGASTIALLAGECLDFRFSSTGAFPAPLRLGCTFERSST